MLVALDTLSAPGTEVFSLDFLKSFLHITTDGDNDWLTFLQKTCRQELEEKLRRALYTQTLQATYELDMPSVTSEIIGALEPVYTDLELPHPPFQSIVAVNVEYTMGLFAPIVPPTYFVLVQEPTVVFLTADAFASFGYPWWLDVQRLPRVQIQYVAGFPTLDAIPGTYKQMLLQLIGWRNLNREDATFPDTLQEALVGNKVWRL